MTEAQSDMNCTRPEVMYRTFKDAGPEQRQQILDAIADVLRDEGASRTSPLSNLHRVNGRTDFLRVFPRELTEMVFSHIHPHELFTLRIISTTWNAYLRSPQLQKRMLQLMEPRFEVTSKTPGMWYHLPNFEDWTRNRCAMVKRQAYSYMEYPLVDDSLSAGQAYNSKDWCAYRNGHLLRNAGRAIEIYRLYACSTRPIKVVGDQLEKFWIFGFLERYVFAVSLSRKVYFWNVSGEKIATIATAEPVYILELHQGYIVVMQGFSKAVYLFNLLTFCLRRLDDDIPTDLDGNSRPSRQYHDDGSVVSGVTILHIDKECTSIRITTQNQSITQRAMVECSLDWVNADEATRTAILNPQGSEITYSDAQTSPNTRFLSVARHDFTLLSLIRFEGLSFRIDWARLVSTDDDIRSHNFPICQRELDSYCKPLEKLSFHSCGNPASIKRVPDATERSENPPSKVYGDDQFLIALDRARSCFKVWKFYPSEPEHLCQTCHRRLGLEDPVP